jgi:hypothetical protein
VAQISLPFRIGLVAALVLVGAMLLLRGGDDSPAPAPVAPGVAGLTSAIDKANGAAATADASAAASEAAAGQVGGAAAPAAAAPTPAAPTAAQAKAARTATAAAALKTLAKDDPSATILRELAAGKTAVILFTSPTAADDAHVRRAVERIDLHRGAVRVHRIALGGVARYPAITRGVQVTQAPTLLVIGGDLKARRIVGYTDRTEINQLVNDVSGLRTRVNPSTYKELIERGCGTTVYNIRGDARSLADRPMRVVAFRDDVQALAQRLRGASVPARFGPFNAQYLRYLTDIDRTLAALKPRSPEKAYSAAVKRLNQLDERINAQAAGTGLDCRA